MNPLTICEVAEHTTFRLENGDDPFTMPVPKAYFIKAPEGAEDIYIWDDYSSSAVGDIYELMFTADVAARAADSHAVMFVTTGWAAPNDGSHEDTAPSKHPERRRVRLAICGTKDGVASAMRFADDPDKVITSDSDFSGALADAIVTMLDGSLLL